MNMEKEKEKNPRRYAENQNHSANNKHRWQITGPCIMTHPKRWLVVII